MEGSGEVKNDCRFLAHVLLDGAKDRRGGRFVTEEKLRVLLWQY